MEVLAMTPELNPDEIAESVTRIRDMIDELRTVVEYEIPILNDVVKQEDAGGPNEDAY
jgi:hypothetical protein